MSSSTVLSCESLSKSFNDAGTTIQVLKEVSLDVLEKECIAIMGASGSGKSTLLHCLGGLDSATSGSVKIQHHLVNKLNENQRSAIRNHYLGFIYQFHHLLPEFDALENVMIPLVIGKKQKKQARLQAEEMLDRVGLSQRIKHRTSELSGGERQRVAIARALVTKPQCVLADEPTGNLDQHTAEKITQLLLQLNRDLNTSFIIVTHNLELADKMHKKLFLVDGHLHVH